jgi:hypothetical protein
MALTRIRGTALAPGASRNRRVYTRQAIARMVERAQPKIKAGQLTMLTHHGAEGDSTRVVGSLTKLAVGEDGSAQFEAELADTRHGRDIAALVQGSEPFVRGVSIRGKWKGPVRSVLVGDQTMETGDDLELDGLDFTPSPGVPGALIIAESAARARPRGRKAIYEEAPAPVEPVSDGPVR